MKYEEFIPGEALKQYVKCYYIYESDTDIVFQDKAFATGCLEIMFNLGTGRWQILEGSDFKTIPFVELWGQIIQPLTFQSLGKNTMLGVRFYPHTASIFLNTDISLFNNQVTDFADVLGNPLKALHSRLLDATLLKQRIELIEEFLLKRLFLFEKKLDRITLIRSVMNELRQEDFFDNINNVASRYGITSRYLQRLFSQHTGLTPKLYSKINRFQNSLQLVAKRNASLTAIAYECGYFDQSHFIREFKSFTGILPSAYDPGKSSAILASSNN
jgi:AraC-like DNA-binding protein